MFHFGDNILNSSFLNHQEAPRYLYQQNYNQQSQQNSSQQDYNNSILQQNYNPMGQQISQRIGQVRVGTRVKQGSKWIDPEYPNFTKILCLTKSTPYGHLGPYVLKDEKGRLMENIWQFSKIWPVYPKSKEYYSQFDKTIIWEHPAELHLNFQTNSITQEYINWRNKGMFNPYPVRYPAGFRHKREAHCSFAEDSNGNIMAISHKTYNVKGVQFHPESILTEHGKTILENWLKQK